MYGQTETLAIEMVYTRVELPVNIKTPRHGVHLDTVVCLGGLYG